MKHRATWAELDRLTVRGLFSAVFFVIMVHYRWNVVRMLVPGLIAREKFWTWVPVHHRQYSMSVSRCSKATRQLSVFINLMVYLMCSIVSYFVLDLYAPNSYLKYLASDLMTNPGLSHVIFSPICSFCNKLMRMWYLLSTD